LRTQARLMRLTPSNTSSSSIACSPRVIF